MHEGAVSYVHTKPARKRSKQEALGKENRGWWDRGARASAQWTFEGVLELTVGNDGIRTRYHGGMCDGTWRRRVFP